MDDRRPNTFRQAQQKKESKPVSGATLGTMIMSAVLGLFFLISFTVGKNFLTHLTVYFFIYTFMLASTLIADFTSVLIDVRDNYIILPKPVNDRTVVVARLLHIIIHISKLILPMTLPAIVFMAIKTNAWSILLFIILTLLNTFLTIFLINALYIFILKVTTPQKFQAVISYFQVGLAIFMYGGYQIALRAIDKAVIKEYDISGLKYIWLAPSYWFAGAWQGLSGFDFQTKWLIAVLLSFTVPFLSIYIVIKYFAPSFNQKLAQISSGSIENATALNKSKTTATTSAWATSLANLVTSKGAERMGFLFCWKMTARSKDFLLKVYPSFGYAAVYLVILILNSKSFTWQSFSQDTTQARIILLSVIYFSSLMLMTAINQVAYSEKFKAAWIYFTAPVATPGLLITGALKAIIAKFYVPIIAVIILPALFVLGAAVIPNLLFAICNLLLICALIAYINNKYLPFSASQTMASKSGGFIRVIISLIIPAIIGIIHYALYSFTMVIIILTLLSGAAGWLVMGSLKNTAWSKVKSTYD